MGAGGKADYLEALYRERVQYLSKKLYFKVYFSKKRLYFGEKLVDFQNLVLGFRDELCVVVDL